MHNYRTSGALGVMLGGFLSLCAVFLVSDPTISPATGESRKHPVPRELQGGAASSEALVDEFLQALGANDEAALHRLRVSRDEYRAVFVPGTVERGQAPRQVSEKPAAFFTTLIDTKSQDFARVLLSRFGGRTYTRTGLQFTEGTQEYAWYTAMGETRISARDSAGEVVTISTGFMAEVNGVYKFIGFEWDE